MLLSRSPNLQGAAPGLRQPVPPHGPLRCLCSTGFLRRTHRPDQPGRTTLRHDHLKSVQLTAFASQAPASATQEVKELVSSRAGNTATYNRAIVHCETEMINKTQSLVEP